MLHLLLYKSTKIGNISTNTYNKNEKELKKIPFLFKVDQLA